MRGLPLVDALDLRAKALRTRVVFLVLATFVIGLAVVGVLLLRDAGARTATLLPALALAIVGAVVLLRRRRPASAVDPLDHALALVRESAARPPADRRRALNLLARVLDRRRPGLAPSVDETAWSRPQPSPEAAEEVADTIEHAVTQR